MMNASLPNVLPGLSSKPHYPVLDGLRGVAAFMVVLFHMFESSATEFVYHSDQIINHGYLCVDFFFMLSGFVIGYAYDDRWGGMTVRGFFKRRLIRLQPMVVMGSLIGAAMFYMQGCDIFANIAGTPVWLLLAVMLIGCTLLPVPLSLDVRGWREMHPLNGPSWSLFFEYIGNILYATILRRLSNFWLSLLVGLAGVALVHQCVAHGNNIGGWSLTAEQLQIGMTRLLFPFMGGLLLYRLGRLGRIKNAFWWCSLMVIAAVSMPHFGGVPYFWVNGIYDSLCIIALFPFIIYLGASGDVSGRLSSKVCKFCGDLSYPLYMVHYPIVYLYSAWAYEHQATTFSKAWPMMALTFLSSVAVAYLCLKLYDEPVRNWLKKRFGN